MKQTHATLVWAMVALCIGAASTGCRWDLEGAYRMIERTRVFEVHAEGASRAYSEKDRAVLLPGVPVPASPGRWGMQPDKNDVPQEERPEKERDAEPEAESGTRVDAAQHARALHGPARPLKGCFEPILIKLPEQPFEETGSVLSCRHYLEGNRCPNGSACIIGSYGAAVLEALQILQAPPSGLILPANRRGRL